MPDVLPASETKHLTSLYHPLPSSSTIVLLQQRSIETSSSIRTLPGESPNDHAQKEGEVSGRGEGTGTTGTTLWLGAQVLACYLSSALLSQLSRNALSDGSGTALASTRQTVLELGSGTGYLALVLAGMGYDVIATDIEPVVSSILQPNIESNMQVLQSEIGSGAGDVLVKQLDWTTALDTQMEDWARRVDMIVMSDTIYHPDLNPHLFETIRRVSQSRLDQSGGKKVPPVYLALERRDPAVVDAALSLADSLGFVVKQVGHARIVKAVNGAGWDLDEDTWAGVEVWKGRWSGKVGSE